MSRCQFNHEDVLRKALSVFHAQGYYAASMQKIFAATGLKPGSLYASFGNKEKLFCSVAELYTQDTLDCVDQVLSEHHDIHAGIAAIFDLLIADADKDEYHGCFLLNHQVELTADDKHLRLMIQDQIQRIEQCYYAFLAKAYSPEQARLYAASLLLQISGLRTYAHREKRPDWLKQIVKQGLPWVNWPVH